MSSDELDSGVGQTGPMSSVSRDVRSVQANSSATAKELRTFLSQMQGKAPREMLGLVAQSNLFKSTLTATVLMAVLIVVFTVIPFGLNQFGGDASETVAAATPAEPTPAAPAPTVPPAEPAGSKAPGETGDPVKSPSSLEDTLGIGDALEAPADVNPLENTGDDLFKDLE